MYRIVGIIDNSVLPKTTLPLVPFGYNPRSWRFILIAERYSVLGIAFEKAFFIARHRLEY